ncbi:SipW-dependent-type signal peptide-containing protein [Pseudokineococcus basanitobsidens]|uniref:SipW-dependent-type signal peptide-containing protein n=1 Tax=Pseudokineococcus basanitobsidens TaxID=1926649 RepID=A0ABU8RLV0_9ACTN
MSTTTQVTSTTQVEAGRAEAAGYRWTTGGDQRRRRTGRLRALLAGGLVVGVGSAVTLASWTDTEWVFGAGGAGGEDVAAGVFEVQQNVWDGAGGGARFAAASTTATAAAASGAGQFVDRERQELAGTLAFTPLAATSLSPGDVVYAPMQLRTTAGSAAASVTLRGAVKGSGDDLFFSALRYAVRSGVERGACGAAAFAPGSPAGTSLVASGSGLAAGSVPGALQLSAGTDDAPGEAVDLCFAITLPGGSSDSLQGRGVSPAWAFDSQSV